VEKETSSTAIGFSLERNLTSNDREEAHQEELISTTGFFILNILKIEWQKITTLLYC
jgi:hypothetical protein